LVDLILLWLLAWEAGPGQGNAPSKLWAKMATGE